MVDKEVNEYRVYCIEEAKYVKSWGTVEPTICPNDHSDRTIATLQTVITNTIATKHVITEEPSTGKFEHTSEVFEVPSGATGAVTEFHLCYPMDIQIWDTMIYVSPDNVGDCVTVIVAPDTTLGILTAGADTGATGLNVNSTVVTNDYISRGIHLGLNNGGTTEHPGRVVAFDAEANTVIMQVPFTQYFPPGTLVQMNLHMIHNLIFSRADHSHKIAQKGFKGKIVPANTDVCIHYTNQSTNAKRIVFYIEYYYT